MTPRAEARVVPDSDRYWCVEVDGDDYHFRFPTYGKAAGLVELLSELKEGDGLDKLVTLVDVAGYAMGVCWFNRGYDLEAGRPPRLDVQANNWRDYGDSVIDELQERGIKLAGIMKLTNSLIEQLGERLGEVDEADTEGND